MKAKLEFDLNDSEDKMSHMRCVKSTDMAIVLFELTHNLKKRLERRFESQQKELDEFDVIDETFMEIRNLLDSHGINISELID
jgi:hypothetical protein